MAMASTLRHKLRRLLVTVGVLVLTGRALYLVVLYRA